MISAIVYVTEVIVDNFSLLESRRDRENRQTNGGNFAPQGGNAPSTNNFGGSSAPSTNNAPAGGESNKPQDPFADSGSTIDISDDDLPF